VKALRWGVAGPATCTDESGAGSSTMVARNSEEMKRIEGGTGVTEAEETDSNGAPCGGKNLGMKGAWSLIGDEGQGGARLGRYPHAGAGPAWLRHMS
jgi:hypothetical protein